MTSAGTTDTPSHILPEPFKLFTSFIEEGNGSLRLPKHLKDKKILIKE